MYQDVMRNEKLSVEAKAIYAYLSSIAGNSSECYPSIETIQRDLSISKGRLSKYMHELIASGIVEKVREKNGNLYGRNVYKITHETEVAEDLKRIFRAVENGAVENGAVENGAVETRTVGNDTTINNNINNNSTNNNNTNSIVCPEPETASGLSGIRIILNDKSFYDVPVEKIALWKETYPAVDIEQELRKMAAWSDANPARRKTKRGIGRFINSWLSREQDRGGRVQQYNSQGVQQDKPFYEVEEPEYFKYMRRELTPEEKAILGEE